MLTKSPFLKAFLIFFLLLLFVFFINNLIWYLAFWLDEAAVALVIAKSGQEMISKAIIDIHPMLYILTIKFWSLIFGMKEIALRSFSAFFGILTVVLLYFAGKDIFKSGKTGLFCCFLGSTNYMLIWFSTQVRPYTMVSFFSLLSVFLFIGLVNKWDKRKAIIFISVTALGLYVHLWMFLVLISEIISLFYLRAAKQLNLKKYYWPVGLTIILGIPSFLIYYKQTRLFAGDLWIDKLSINTITDSITTMSFGNTYVYLFIMVVPIVTGVYKKAASLAKKKNTVIIPKIETIANIIFIDKTKIRTVLFFYLFFPSIFLIIFSLFKPVYVAGRYEMLFLPALILGLGFLLSKINMYLVAGILLFITGLTVNTVYAQKNSYLSYKSTDKSVMEDILKRANKDDLIIATDLSYATMTYYTRYYDPNNAKEIIYSSYPSNTKNHPGYKVRYDVQKDRIKLQKEAGELVSLADVNKSKTVYVLYNSDNPVNEILVSQFKAENYAMSIAEPEKPREPSWFDKIIIFRK